MASHHHPHMPHATACHCCCTTTAQPQPDPFLQAIDSHLTNLHNTPHIPRHHSIHHQQQEQQHKAILISLISRIESLELSLLHSRSSLSSSTSCHCRSPPTTLRHLAAKVIQTHFRAFLVRRSRALRQLKELAFIKTRFSALKSKVSGNTHLDFEAVYRKAMGLLVKLDRIQGGDPMVRDGKRRVSRELARFLDYIDEVAVRRCEESVVVVRKGLRVGDGGLKSRVVRSRRGDGDVGGVRLCEMRVLKERVERMRKLSKGFQGDERVDNVGVFGEDEDEDAEEEEEDEDEEEPKVVRRGKNGVSRVPIETIEKRHGVQSKPKKIVSFSDVHRIYDDHEELISNEDNCTDGSGSSDGSAEVEKLRNEVDRMSNLLQNVENAKSSMNNAGSLCSRDVERNSSMNTVDSGSKQNGKDEGELLVSAPLPLKMEPRSDLLNKKEQQL